MSGFDAVDGPSTGTRVPLSATRELTGFSALPRGRLASARRIEHRACDRARAERRAVGMLAEMKERGERIKEWAAIEKHGRSQRP
jgi:hypothetical protein